MESVREIRAEHDRLLDLAVVKPTPVNVLAYHQFKTKMLAQSETFSAVSQSVSVGRVLRDDKGALH